MIDYLLRVLKRLHYRLAYTLPSPAPFLARLLDRFVLARLERAA